MPMELFRRSYHAISPPLTEYIHKNDLEGLERKLKNGADPNAVSTRNYWEDEAMPPLVYAKNNNNLEAIKILAKYGAKATPEIFSWIRPEDIAIFQFIFDSGVADDIDFNADKRDLVFQWTKSLLVVNRQKEIDAISSCIALLLQHGASPNNLGNEGLMKRKTALDLLAQPELNEVDVSGLVKIMKANGALTYDELVKVHPEYPHLEINGDVHPIFKNVVRNIEKQYPQLYISTKYPGLDCPVLVIDKKEEVIKGQRPQYLIRSEAVVHRRESPTSWRLKGEHFDIPAGYRIVLTPPGVKLPSRLVDGIPSACFIHEEWYSFPNCEVYFEQPTHFFDNSSSFINELPWLQEIADANPESVKELAQQTQKSTRESSIDIEHHALLAILDCRNQIYLTDKQKVLMQKAGRLLRGNGFHVNWLPINSAIHHIDCAFSTRRTSAELPSNLMDFIPYPDEIIVLVEHDLNSTLSKNSPEIHRIIPNSKNGLTYWNSQFHHITYGTRHPFSLTVLYGDEVAEESIAKIVDILKTIF